MAIWLKKKTKNTAVNQKVCERISFRHLNVLIRIWRWRLWCSVVLLEPVCLCVPAPDQKGGGGERLMRGDIDIPAVEYHILQPHSSSPGVSSDHRSPGTNLPWHRVSTLGHRIGSPRCPACSHQPHPRTRNPKKWRLLLFVPQLAVNVKTSISFSPTWFVKPFFFLFGLQYLVFSAGGSQTTPTLLPGVKAYQ